MSSCSRSRSRSPKDRGGDLDRHGNPRRTSPADRRRRDDSRGGDRKVGDRRGGYREERKSHAKNDTPSKCIGIFGMSFHTSEREIIKKFEEFGEVEKCNLIWNNQANRSKGFAFVYMREIDDAKTAVEKLNGQDLDGREVRVDYSFTKQGHESSRSGGDRDRGSNRDRRRSRSPRRRRRSRSDSRDHRRRSRSRSYDRRRR